MALFLIILEGMYYSQLRVSRHQMVQRKSVDLDEVSSYAKTHIPLSMHVLSEPFVNCKSSIYAHGVVVNLEPKDDVSWIIFSFYFKENHA